MKRIMAVDNHPVMLKFMQKLLQKEGYDVETAEDGLSALAALKRFKPDVVFVDLVMPNIDGERLCRIIRSMPQFDDTCLIIVSSIAIEKNEKVFALGADACIAKGPFNKMSKHILNILDRLKKGDTREFHGKIYGREYVFEREISKELISSNRHRELILENMLEGILELSQFGKIVYANPSAISLIQIPEEELLGAPFTRLFQERDQTHIQSIIEAVLEKSMRYETPETSPIKLNDRIISITVLPMLKDDDKPLVVIINDLTDRKKMESRLNQALKMEAIGTLSGGIAHDFNNLLQSIQSNISLMLLDVDMAHPFHEYLKKIENTVSSGAKLTEQLLGYARKGRYEIKTIDLNQLVKETSDIFCRTKREITIERAFAEDLLPIDADPGQIEQMLLNLFVNAWQAMPDGGTLYLKTYQCTEKDIKATVYAPKVGNYIKLMVTDTGIGIDKEIQAKIFDPFFTTKEIGRGTGLGLASVYGIVKGHNGYIEVESETGKGTTFHIYFPVSTQRLKQEEVSFEKPLNETETILFVDDEEDIVDATSRVLKLLGFDVLTALNGEEAVKIYQTEKEKIDIVILDLIMPDMSGGKVFDRIKHMNPNAKVLLASGYSINGKAKDIVRRGCSGFIQKPFEIKQLYAKIREILNNK